MFQSSTVDGSALAASETELWLRGQPPLHHYLDYVMENAITETPLDRAHLIKKWGVANDRYAELETTENGFPDKIQVSRCPSSLVTKISAIENTAPFKRTFNSVPTRFAMVELDRLIVTQPHINLKQVIRLKAQLCPNPSPDDLFDFCFPLSSQLAPVKVRKIGAQRYQFWSPSSDFRFQEATLLPADQHSTQKALGAIGAILGIAVGFGPNFLSAIQHENRLVLDNGHHRAYALRDLGLTHAPCIIETVTRVDELAVVASQEVADNPAFYFKAARPPVLKDFFDPEIYEPVRIHRTSRIVEVSFEVKSFDVADLPIAGGMHDASDC